MRTFLSAFLIFLAVNVCADEGLHAKGRQVPVILNGGEHLLVGKSRDGKIQIEDGTMFKALSSEAATIFEDWDYHEHITFSPNPYPGGGSEFYVLNIDRGEFVHANLHSIPNPKNEYTLRLKHIDPYDGEIIFWRNSDPETEQRWFVELKDLDYLINWENHDRVIIGMNSNWYAPFFSDCKFILVNCDKHGQTTYVRVRPNRK